jgi:hypothetical protein
MLENLLASYTFQDVVKLLLNYFSDHIWDINYFSYLYYETVAIRITYKR